MRKRITIGLTLLCLVGISAAIIMAQAPQVAVRAPITPQVTRAAFAIRQVPAQQVVYKLTPRFQTIEQARSRAEVLGLRRDSLPQMTKVEDEFRLSDGKWDYRLDPEKQMELLFDHELMIGKVGASPVLPNLDQCRDVALNFLGTKNLIMGGADEELRYERTNEMVRSFVSLADQGRPPSSGRVIMREVVFSKYVKGVPVMGPGSRVSVFVGDQGKVAGYMSNWMPAVATQEKLDVAPPDVGFARFKERVARSNQKLPNRDLQARTVDVKRGRYALNAFPNEQGELVLMPAYEFKATGQDAKGAALEFNYRVLAPKNPTESLRKLRITAPAAERVPPVQQLKIPARLTAPAATGTIRTIPAPQ